MAVSLRPSAARLEVGTPQSLFLLHTFSELPTRYDYGVARDGQRFLVLAPVKQPEPRPITVVVNWQALLKR